MPFKQYRKIHRLGVEENEGIFDGSEIFVNEKIDGANTQIWVKEDGGLGKGSRSQDVTAGTFNGFCEYVEGHEGIKKLLSDFPHYHLYGEWLVRHTLKYKETAYRHWYMFDIRNTKEDKMLTIYEVNELAEKYGIKVPQLFGVFENPTVDQIKEFVGRSELGEIGEGVVIKNFNFRNKFGDLEYAKIVTDKFKEDNALVFGGNNRHSETYWEMFIVNKYVSLERVQKIINKIQPTLDCKIRVEDTARVINSVYHDFIVEEIWEIQKKVPVLNFKDLKRLSTRKAAQIFHDILNESYSVADLNKNI